MQRSTFIEAGLSSLLHGASSILQVGCTPLDALPKSPGTHCLNFPAPGKSLPLILPPPMLNISVSTCIFNIRKVRGFRCLTSNPGLGDSL